MRIKISIDPGKCGAIAVSIDGKVHTHDCPDTQSEIVELVKEMSVISELNNGDISAIIEKVHSMPKQGVKSVWTFSANYATWQTALICLKIPFKEVTPQLWQKKLGNCPADKKERKLFIKDCMQKRYPDLKVTLKNADALALLSVWDQLP